MQELSISSWSYQPSKQPPTKRPPGEGKRNDEQRLEAAANLPLAGETPCSGADRPLSSPGHNSIPTQTSDL